MKKMLFIMVALIGFVGCEGKSSELVRIPEASGICFSQKSKTLFVANDEGFIYEITKEGKILRRTNVGHHNLEGVACDDEKGMLLFAEEGKDNILEVSQKTLRIRNKIKIPRTFKGKLILKKDWKHHGLEGIAIVGNSLFLSNQSKKFYPKKDPSLLIRVNKNEKKKAKIQELFEHGHKDISGLTYHDNYLYMVSDKEDLLLKYDLKSKKVIATAKLPPYAQEGVTFDDEGAIYIANDKGSVYKYEVSTLGL